MEEKPYKVKAIVAYTKEGRVIGNGDDMPWYLPEDFKHFKKTTSNAPIIMGRKTWDSLPKKPLPNRINFVVSRNKSKGITEAVVGIEPPDPKTEPLYTRNIENALGMMMNHEWLECHLGHVPDTIWVIGGQQIYEYCLKKDILDEIVATEIKKEYDGDKFFPKLEEGKWERQVESDNDDFQVVRYKKVE